MALAVSFIPLIGEVLLVSSGVQLITEVYQGFDAWRRDEKVEALNDLMDIAEQVALMEPMWCHQDRPVRQLADSRRALDRYVLFVEAGPAALSPNP
ncbi:hypothetical protein QNM99_14215 [Pseudomonas sp. PCH446]